METEGGEFLQRFQIAASGLEEAIHGLNRQIVKDLSDLALSINQTEFSVSESSMRITGTAESAEENAMDAAGHAEEQVSMLQEIRDLMEQQDPTLDLISEKLDALLKNFQIEDPRITTQKRLTRAMVGGISLESRKRGMDCLPPALRKRVESVLAKRGTIWHPESVNEAMTDLAEAERNYAATSGKERFAVDAELKNLFSQDTMPPRLARRRKRT